MPVKEWAGYEKIGVENKHYFLPFISFVHMYCIFTNLATLTCSFICQCTRCGTKTIILADTFYTNMYFTVRQMCWNESSIM